MLLRVTNFKKLPPSPNHVSQPAAKLCVAQPRQRDKVVVTWPNNEGRFAIPKPVCHRFSCS